MEKQLGYKIYIGAKTALALQSYTHYVQMEKSDTVWLFKLPNENRQLPKWFQDNFMDQQKIYFLNQDLFSPESLVGLTSKNQDSDFLDLTIASPERAIIECMDLLPKYFAFEDLRFLMESGFR